MTKTSWKTGNLKSELRSVESFKGPIVLLDALVGYLPKLREKQSMNSSFWKKYYDEFSWLCFFAEGIWKEDILIIDFEKLKKGDR